MVKKDGSPDCIIQSSKTNIIPSETCTDFSAIQQFSNCLYHHTLGVNANPNISPIFVEVDMNL